MAHYFQLAMDEDPVATMPRWKTGVMSRGPSPPYFRAHVPALKFRAGRTVRGRGHAANDRPNSARGRCCSAFEARSAEIILAKAVDS